MPADEFKPASDGAIVRTLWLVLVAAVISQFPFTVYSTFLVPIAESAGEDAAVVGAMRGLGGIAALVIGVAFAPLAARWSAPHTTAASLALLSATSLIATSGTLPALVVFCFGIGAATAILTPTLLKIATTAFSDREDAGRAATIVTATHTLAAVLAAPVLGVLALWQGWRGALWVTAGVAAFVAATFLRPSRAEIRTSVPSLRYTEAFARLRRRPDLLVLIATAFLRTTAFMGYAAFLAAYYHDRFGLDAVTFTLVWTLSGGSFFVGNFLAGRWTRGSAALKRRLHYIALIFAAVAPVVVFTTDMLPLALVGTTVMSFSHAVVAAIVTTLIADRGGELTATAFSINAAAMSLGVFVGAFVVGVGLALGGALGMAIAVVVPTLIAIGLVPLASREPR